MIKFFTSYVFAIFLIGMSYELVAKTKYPVLVKGGGTYLNIPSVDSNSSIVYEAHFDIRATKNRIHKGSIKISSSAAGHFQPVAGVDYEFTLYVDTICVHAELSDHLIVHGQAVGTIRYGGIAEDEFLQGQTFTLDETTGECVAIFTKWGSTKFIIGLENDEDPLPDITTVDLPDLLQQLGGYQVIMLHNGALPNKLKIRLPLIEHLVIRK